MLRKIEIAKLECLVSYKSGQNKIAYILYPMNILEGWIEQASEKYNTSIVVITGMDWQNVFSPWPAKGVPKGSPDFEGNAPDFLHLLQDTVIPELEKELGFADKPQRTLIGVSMSGLFTLWQWMKCDTFDNIASLSGSFWYDGFIDWFRCCQIPAKRGNAYFLLGDQEAKSKVKAFDSVSANTQEIITILNGCGIKTEFQSVPGNHYANPIPRLEAAFTGLQSMDIAGYTKILHS